MSPKPLVWINGYPGTGKLTIAKFLTKRLLGNDKAMLIHNHILIDPIAWCFGNPIKEPEWYRIRHALRAGLFENYVKNPSELHKTIVFTDSEKNTKDGRSFSQGYKDVVESVGRAFLPIYLSIDYDENMRRGISENRTYDGRQNSATVEKLTVICGRGEPFVFPEVEGIHLDVTHLSAEEAARTLLGKIEAWYARQSSGSLL